MKATITLAVLACAWCLACMVLTGCAVGWQINMPASYGQCHSRGSSYNALATKALSPSGESEALQQQRASTVTGDALGTTVEADKATDLAAAKDQSQVTTETAKAARDSTGTASGALTPTSTPKKSESKAATTAIAKTGALAKGQAPVESDGTTQGGDDSAGTAPAATVDDAAAKAKQAEEAAAKAKAAEEAKAKADAEAAKKAAQADVASCEADLATAQKTADLCGTGGGKDGANTPAQQAAQDNLARAKAALAAAKLK